MPIACTNILSASKIIAFVTSKLNNSVNDLSRLLIYKMFIVIIENSYCNTTNKIKVNKCHYKVCKHISRE